MRLKIIQINASYKPALIYGGPTMSVAMLCEQLIIAGIDITVLTTTANGANDLPQQSNANIDGVKVTYFKRLTKDHTHFSPALLIKLWKDVKNHDLVHIHAWWNTVSVLSCLIALLRDVPVVVSPRGTLSPYSFSNKNRGIKSILHKFLGKPLLNKCHIHVTSEREQQAIAQLVTPVSITNIANFVKLPVNFVARHNTPTDTLRLLFFSRIEEKKGLDILIKALANVKLPYHLTIAGIGDESYITYLKKLAADHNITGFITWAGFYGENKFELLSEHDLFILPSHDENFANTVIESLSVGTAVLVSQNVGLYNYVEQNKLGWVCDVNSGSVTTFINNIGIHCREELINIRKNAPAIIYNDFKADKLVEQYITMYNQIIYND
jgi:glycosyltransferase involved in cell wall biosynthesis